RLEAVRAASFFTDSEAVEVALISSESPSDYYLDYTRGETLKTLEPYWKKGIAGGKAIDFKSDAAARFFLGKVGTEDLMKMKHGRGVCLEILFRKGVRDEDRRRALADLAKITNASQPKALIDALRGRDSVEGDPGESVVLELVPLLAGRPAAELAGERGEIEGMATGANLEIIRQFGFAALIAADGRADQAWDLANRSVPALRTFLGAISLIRDPEVRAGLYPRVVPLLHHLPAGLRAPKEGKGTHGRFVRVELPGRRTLTLAEVEVFSDGRNVAPRGKASQKNTTKGGQASRAIDGKTGGAFGEGGQSHSAEMTSDPWWEVDLGAEVPIDSIVIHNRTDGELSKRLDGFALKVLDARRKVVFEKVKMPAPTSMTAVEVGGAGPEGVIRRAAMNALTSVRGQEGPTFKALAAFIREGVDRPTAILALRRIPVAYWPQEDSRPLLQSLIAYVRDVPARERTSGAPLDAIQLGDSLAALLPADQARAFRKELAELGVRVIRIGSVPDQMRFDLERIAVGAGKPVEILFENIDIMPHNFVVTAPGALEEVGLLAESTATRPDALERQYVPPSDKVLFASRLLQPRESQRLAFAAPTRPGVYPYVCTYPGHWRRMYGALYVVEDLGGYLENPESYLAAHPLPIRDDLLKSSRPRKEWALDDLASSVAELDHGRSFANGKQLFGVATCVSCHKMNGVGQEFGPDLAKLDLKRTPVDILKHVLEPSAEIEDKFAAYLFETESGQVVTGMVLEETPEAIKVIENPLAKAEPRLLKPSEVTARKKSPTSIMPKGLLDKLAREEILDLIAYLASRGDQDHPLVKGGDGHHHGAGH
ncbi:MAG: c-type cytochrome, partial [Singulisphaera sp.]